ncbi:MAG: transporter substrate-binding domain-containing protein [Oscillospiraceae bacterium]|nr:transporter substrate-binding domain-containing protein [Oscillospiraceae bacterium]
MKKVLALILALIMALGLIACGAKAPADTDAPADSDAPVVSETPTIDAIKAKGELVVGTSADYPPYEFHTEIDGVDTIVGFDIAISQYFADALGVTLKVVDMPFDSLLIGLNEGEFDLVMAGMTANDERRKVADFTDIIFANDQIVMIRKVDAEKFTTIESLVGHKVGAQTGSDPYKLAAESYGEDCVVGLVKNQDLVMELKAGKIDAVQTTSMTAIPYVTANDDLMIQDVGFPMNEAGFSGAIPKDQADFLAFLNEQLANMKAQGLIEQYVTEAQALANAE